MMDEKKYKTFWIFGGMGGGFGGPHYLGETEATSIDDKFLEEDALQLITEEYESYAGLHGILSWDDVYEAMCEEYRSAGEPLPTDSEVQEAYEAEIASWASWWAMEAVPGENPEDPKWIDMRRNDDA